jgi:chitin disaccharide deacetylase
MIKLRLTILLILLQTFNYIFVSAQNNLPKLVLRTDDIGMNHSVNLGLKELAETKIPFSASVMFACPWYQEAVDILKQNPQVAVGVHLTLTAEWKYYRWGPVLGQTAVPSLVDSLGYFLPSVDQFLKSKYMINDVEKELTAQIERAIATGLKISYVDPHMGIAVSTPELKALTMKLAKKYGLGISAYFGEEYKSMWGVSVDTKKKEFMNYVNSLKPGLHVVELHIAHSTPEIDALVDMNSNLMNTNSGKPMASQHRQTELNMLLSPDFRNLNGKKFNLITYREVVKENGLEKMTEPKEAY